MNGDEDITVERDGREEDGMSEVDLDEQESRADTKLAKLKNELESVKKERQEYMDGWQRAKADYVNALKRFEEERKASQRLGASVAMNALLPAYDALLRAQENNEIPDNLQNVAKLIAAGFAGLGLTQIMPAPGDQFDPVVHEALGQDPVDSAEKDDTVTTVLQIGWRTPDDVVRPARVRVGHYES